MAWEKVNDVVREKLVKLINYKSLFTYIRINFYLKIE